MSTRKTSTTKTASAKPAFETKHYELRCIIERYSKAKDSDEKILHCVTEKSLETGSLFEVRLADTELYLYDLIKFQEVVVLKIEEYAPKTFRAVQVIPYKRFTAYKKLMQTYAAEAEGGH